MDARVLEIGSASPLAGVQITNVNLGSSVLSDMQGRFRISVRKGDLLVLTLYSYVSDTVFVTDVKTRDFFLQAISHQLKDVTITGVNTQLGSLVDKETFRRNTGYQRNDDGTMKGGLTFRLRYWNKDSKKERRSQRKIRDYLVEEEIDRVFSVSYIEKHTPLTGDELLDFRGLYRPTVKAYKSPDFHLLLYLNQSYRHFKSLPPEKRRLPKLEPFDPR